MAKSKIRRDPSLRGSGLATAGLIIGYVLCAIWIVWFAMVGHALIKAFREGTTLPGNPPFQQDAGGKVRNSRPAALAPGNDTPLELPSNPVTGKLGARDFTYDTAELRGGSLTLRQGGGVAADAEIRIILFEDQKTLAGKTITVRPGVRGTLPHIHANWKENGLTQNIIRTSGYTMTLHFESIEGDKVQGNIDFKVPGKPAATLKGDFIARLR
ncbi:MAG: hypothetical protein QOF48_2480 [Verrucomicrobiota bacterium]